MRFTLHIGQSKTGSSAIQSYLTLNRAALMNAGVLYPQARVGRWRIDLGSHNSVADSLTGLSRYPCLRVEQYREQFLYEASRIGASSILLSGEHFFGGEPRVWSVNDESDYFLKYSIKLKALREFLGEYPVTVIVYLRPQIEWLESAISQTVRIERLMSDSQIYVNDEQFFRLVRPLLRYGTLLKLWDEHVRPSEWIVVPYDKDALIGRSVISDFLWRTNLDSVRMPYASSELQVNPSFSRRYIEVKKRLNRSPKSKSVERVTIKCLEKLSKREANYVPYRISSALAEKVEAYVADENAIVNDQYLDKSGRLLARSSSAIADKAYEFDEADIDRAEEAFLREFQRLGTKAAIADDFLRSFLRKYGKPVHGLLHQVKRCYRAYRFRR